MSARLTGALALVVVAATGACTRMHAPGFPPPARPPVLVELTFEQAFASLASIVESRGIPVLVADEQFGSIRTDWVYFDPGEVDLTQLADCHVDPAAPLPASRVRYGFEVRRRANRATVTILTQYQVEAHRGFEPNDISYADCASTGEWERMIEQSLTQRGTIR